MCDRVLIVTIVIVTCCDINYICKRILISVLCTCNRRFAMARNWEPWFCWSVRSVKTLTILSVINLRSSTSMFTIRDSCGGADDALKRHRWLLKRLKLWKRHLRRKFDEITIRLKRTRMFRDWKSPEKEMVIFLGRTLRRQITRISIMNFCPHFFKSHIFIWCFYIFQYIRMSREDIALLLPRRKYI